MYLLESAALGIGLGAGEGSLVEARRASAACLAGPAHKLTHTKNKWAKATIRTAGRDCLRTRRFGWKKTICYRTFIAASVLSPHRIAFNFNGVNLCRRGKQLKPTNNVKKKGLLIYNTTLSNVADHQFCCSSSPMRRFNASFRMSSTHDFNVSALSNLNAKWWQ